MKCKVCGNKIEQHFLDKIEGTYVDGKPVCSGCQKSHSMEELKEEV